MKKAPVTFRPRRGQWLVVFFLLFFATGIRNICHAAEPQKGSPIWFGNYSTDGMPSDVTNLVDIASQQSHTIALRDNGEVIAWGGGLGGAYQVPAGLPPAKKIAAGYYFGMALLNDGTVRVWGAWGHVYQVAITTPPSSATNVVEIAAGRDHCLAVRTDGRVIAWGSDLWGQLAVPSNVTNALFVAGGGDYSVAVTSSKQIVGWGNSSFYSPGSVPTALNNPTRIFMGDYHTVGLNANGLVLSWGDNSKGQSTSAGITNGFAVAAGSQHTLAAYGDGLLKAYGDNTYGQARTPTNFPKVFKIAGGDQHSVALTRAPVILGVNANWTVHAGDDALLDATVLASDAYQAQWFLNGSPVPGALSPRWAATNIQSNTSGPYELIVSNEFGMTRSGPLQFNVQDSGLRWTLQPTNAAALPGSAATFAVDARGTEPKGYQWYHDGLPIQGGSTNRLVLNSVALADEGRYWAIATNAYSSVKSDEVRLVAGLPVILQEPFNQRARSGWNLQLNAETLSASSVSFQWFHDGAPIEGATNPALSILSLDTAAKGRYQLRVTNAAGEIWSREATVELLPSDLPERLPGVGVVWGNGFFDETGGSSAAVDLVQTAVGQGWLAGLHANGTVETWADGGFFKPALGPATNVIGISAGLSHIIGMRRDGTVVGIGQALPEGLTNVVALSAGENTSLFAKRDGSVVTVGAEQPPGISNVVSVAAGNQDHMAVLADGRVFCWSRWHYFEPYFAVGVTNAVAAAGGEYSSIALLADGTVATWGRTFQGPQPATIIPGVSNVVEIAFYRFAIARLGSGQVIGIGGSDQRTIPNGLRATSISASIGLGSAVSILPFFDTQPVPLQVYEHGSAQMTVNVRGPGILSYQWLKDNVAVPGATNSTLEISGAAVRQTGLYKLRASNANGSAESLPAKITVLGKPEITAQPAQIEVSAGRDVDLTVAWVSAEAATFRWEFEGIPIPGAVTNSLRIANAQSAHAGTYQLLISNSYGTTASLPIQLSVQAAAPLFTLQPAILSVRDGESAEFKAAVIGTMPINYQWFHENTAIPGATSPNLQIDNVQAGQAGAYHLTAQNSQGTTISDNVFLFRTNSPPLPQVSPPFRLSRQGRTARFDAKILAGSDPGGFSFHWKHAGTNLPAATNSWLIATDTGAYSVEISNSLGSAESSPAQMYLLPARTPGVVRTWGGRTTVRTPDGLIADEATQGLNFGAAVLPDGSVTLWGTPPGGTNTPVNFKDIIALAASDSILYGLRNDGRALVLQSSGVSDFGDSATNLISLSAGSGHALALRADGILIGWGPTNVATIPVAATNISLMDAAGSRNLAMRADGVFINWGTGNTAALTNTPAAVSNVVALAATTTQNAALRKDGSVVVWAGSGAPAGNSNFVALVSGQSHFIALRNDGSVSMWGPAVDGQTTKPADVTNIVSVAAGTISSHAIVTTPRLLSTTASQTVGLGTTFTLRSFAVGAGTLAFQWFLNNAPVPGATFSNLTLTAASSNFGTYSVIVSNEWTSIKSGNYAVNLGSPPAILTQPTSQVAVVGSPITFGVDASGSGTLAYQWMLNGVRLVGATSRTLTLSNVFSIDSGGWTVRITNSFGSAESIPATLTVGQYPTNSPALRSFEFNSGSLSISAAVESNAFYRLQISTNLLNWEDLKSFVASSNIFEFVSPSPTNTQRFYRLVTP